MAKRNKNDDDRSRRAGIVYIEQTKEFRKLLNWRLIVGIVTKNGIFSGGLCTRLRLILLFTLLIHILWSCWMPDEQVLSRLFIDSSLSINDQF